ncbi:uncharacterized protein ACRADG_002039 [Cochliomyia hominivorax]
MRIFMVAFAVIAVAASAAIDSPLNEYLPPSEDTATLEPTNNDDSAVLGDAGYRYKTLRRLKYRQRRDVSELADEYLPPAEEVTTEVVAENKSAEKPEDSSFLGENGYKYKTVRRLKYRNRRDISEIPNEYLPPVEGTTTETLAEVKSAEEPVDSAVLGENGYEYKTVRHLKYRNRRDVSETATENLPPTEEETTEALAEVKSAEQPEYLPPAEEATTEALAEVKSAAEPVDSAALGENGYEYKTVRRLKYRHRRDVSEIANEYLPPAEEATTEALAEVKSAEQPEDSAVLGENGYEYKTVRRLKYRIRRDVSEIANEYLPPAEEETTEALAEVKSAEQPEDSAVLGENGYEYKTVRRLKYRQRRDVSENANEYLPPAEETTTEALAEVKSAEEPVDSAVLGENGYEYKTVRRLKYRQRRY